MAAILIFLAACGSSKKLAAPPVAGVTPAPAVAAVAVPPPAPVNTVKTDALLEDLLKAYPQYFDTLLQQRAALKLQIIYTQIDRQANNQPVFKTYYFNVDSTDYLYPASTVKLPVALLALQKLHELRLPGLDRSSSMITEAAYSGQTPVYNDPTTPDGRPTIEQYVKKILLVSDNNSFNRLYEFLGQQYINERLHKMGYGDAEILHRLDVFLTPDENRHTNPVNFFDPGGKLLYGQPMQENNTVYSQRSDSLGKGYFSGTELVNHAMNFSGKNRISLEDLTGVLKSVLFPAAVPARQRFGLTADDYKLVRQYMSQYPGETLYPSYDTAVYGDAFVKFLLYGSEKRRLPKTLRIFNKVGDAYGCLTDVAYVADYDKQVEFMLSARIYCNSDGNLNDDKYDYDTVGFPFMKHLGEIIYAYELQRSRPRKPDLNEFKMTYDK
ncbi:MAG TPA: serine hydrolase [Chitinophagaceae bacterium]